MSWPRLPIGATGHGFDRELALWACRLEADPTDATMLELNRYLASLDTRQRALLVRRSTLVAKQNELLAELDQLTDLHVR